MLSLVGVSSFFFCFFQQDSEVAEYVQGLKVNYFQHNLNSTLSCLRALLHIGFVLILVTQANFASYIARPRRCLLLPQ